MMVEKHFCDIPCCNEEAIKLGIDMCTGYLITTGKIKYEPFERPQVLKHGLCEKHFKAWCKATYGIIPLEVEI